MTTLLLLFNHSLSAQELGVKSMELLSNDATASSYDYQFQDANGDCAGIVKVHIAMSGVEFEGGGVLKQEKHGMAEYWVWMAKDSSRLKVNAPGFLPLEVNFRAYEGVNVIHSKSTYKLVITIPAVGQVQQDDGLRYLAMVVEPKNATLVVNGSRHKTENGEFSVLLPKGTYDYEVSADNCEPQRGSVTLDDNASPLHVRLANSSATLKVTCSTEGARIYVNGQEKGIGSWTGSVSPGYYKVEARLAGHQSYSETVNLASNANRTLNIPALQALTGILNVNYSPIGSDVYMDGQKVGVTPNIFRNVSVGAHKVEIRKDGYTTLTRTVTVEENKQAELSGSLAVTLTQTLSNGNDDALQTTISFQVDRYYISDAQKKNLKSVATFLAAHPDINLIVMGYADIETMYPAYNLRLSQKRAQAVYDMLVKDFNVPPNRLRIDYKADTLQPYANVKEVNAAVRFILDDKEGK